MAAPKKNAVLLIGPPMSKAIIPPRIKASTTLFPVLMAFRALVASAIRSAIGTPNTFSITTPIKAPERMGITRIGMIGRKCRETGIFLRSSTT